MAEFVSGRQLRAKRQAARRQKYGDDYVTGKVKAARAEMAESDRIGEEVAKAGRRVAMLTAGAQQFIGAPAAADEES